MGTVEFPIPSDRAETLRLLNKDGSNMSIWREDGKMYVFAGDQPVFVTDEQHEPEVEAFLAGMFLDRYYGKSLKDIYPEVDQS